MMKKNFAFEDALQKKLKSLTDRCFLHLLVQSQQQKY